MKTMAIVCEYNPFHNGHLYQLGEQKKQLGADTVVCIMSGNFTQRGIPAVCDKWARAKMALANGCDMVIEIPTVFAVASAERFSFSAVSILNSLGAVDYLCFGSEQGDTLALSEIADKILDGSLNELIGLGLKSGMSYPSARADAVRAVMGEEYAAVIAEPNNILALEYIKALKRLNSRIKPCTLKRYGCGYHDKKIIGGISSASNIRQLMDSGRQYKELMPQNAYEILQNEIMNGKAPISLSYYDDIALYKLRSMSLCNLSKIADVSEGLENRLKKASEVCGNINEISEYVKTKRYTKTRIDRIIINLILDITMDLYECPCEYARILGFNENGRRLLSKLSKNIVPIIKATDGEKLSDGAKRLFEKDVFATDIYCMAMKNEKFRISNMDYLKRFE